MRVTFSPIPSITALLQLIKRATSAPILGAIWISSFSLNLFAILFIPTRTAAALPLPPPSPAPSGILFFIEILTLKFSPLSLQGFPFPLEFGVLWAQFRFLPRLLSQSLPHQTNLRVAQLT